MRIVVSSQGQNLEAQASPVFGRCPTYVFVDSETMGFEALSNPAMNQGGGAGIQAAQFVVNQGAQAVLSGSLGPTMLEGLGAHCLEAGLVVEEILHCLEGCGGAFGPSGNAHLQEGVGVGLLLASQGF